VGRDPLGYVDGMGLYGGYFVPNTVDPSGQIIPLIIGVGVVGGILLTPNVANGPSYPGEGAGMTERQNMANLETTITLVTIPAGGWTLGTIKSALAARGLRYGIPTVAGAYGGGAVHEIASDVAIEGALYRDGRVLKDYLEIEGYRQIVENGHAWLFFSVAGRLVRIRLSGKNRPGNSRNCIRENKPDDFGKLREFPEKGKTKTVEQILREEAVAPRSGGPGEYVRSNSPAVQRTLPKNKHGVLEPDVNVPHTQLGRSTRSHGAQPQAREWMRDSKGRLVPKRDIDFTDHNFPDIHPMPHQHKLTPVNPNNPVGGGFNRGKPEPLQ